MKITVLILTKDEARHIARALHSVSEFADSCVVVDSGSTDKTLSIAEAAGAEILVNPWINHAAQFNWGLSKLPDDTDWVMRLDADEIVSPELAAEINNMKETMPADVNGVHVSRRIHFMGQKIKWGGVFPIRILRLFRYSYGRCENRWMDEHLIVSGRTLEISGEIVDDNLNSLTWWTEKHNTYASREVIDILNQEYGFLPQDTVADLSSGQQAEVKRWVKEVLYRRLPGGKRAVLYFCYRYFIRLGFLDGKRGIAFHFLQGFWYRYLVDLKLYEVRMYMVANDTNVLGAIRDVLGFDLEDG